MIESLEQTVSQQYQVILDQQGTIMSISTRNTSGRAAESVKTVPVSADVTPSKILSEEGQCLDHSLVIPANAIPAVLPSQHEAPNPEEVTHPVATVDEAMVDVRTESEATENEKPASPKPPDFENGDQHQHLENTEVAPAMPTEDVQIQCADQIVPNDSTERSGAAAETALTHATT